MHLAGEKRGYTDNEKIQCSKPAEVGIAMALCLCIASSAINYVAELIQDNPRDGNRTFGIARGSEL